MGLYLHFLKLKWAAKAPACCLLLRPQGLQRSFPLPLGGGLGLDPKGAGMQVSWKVRSRTCDSKLVKPSVQVRKTLLRVDTETGVCLQYFQASKLAPLGAVASGPTLMSDDQTEMHIPVYLHRPREASLSSVLMTSKISSFQITHLTFERLMC